MSEPKRLSGFDPITPDWRDAPRSSPSWEAVLPAASRNRIGEADTVHKAQVQATTEAVILLHSIRRIMLWVAVVSSVAALVLIVALFAALV